MKQTTANVNLINKITTVSIRNQVKIPLQFHHEGSTAFVDFITFYGLCDEKEHLALGFNDWRNEVIPLIRIHSECLTGDIFGSLHCDCGKQLEECIQQMSKSSGILLYLRQEGRGIGLYNKLDCYTLQKNGLNTFEANESLGYEADLREYYVAAQMLTALNINQIKLLTNNDDKVRQLEGYGVKVVERISTRTYVNTFNKRYLKAKAYYSNHQLKI